MPGNDGVPDPVLKLPIKYVLLNLSSALGKLNVIPAWPNDCHWENNVLVLVLSTLVIWTVINPPLIEYELLVPDPKSIELFWKP